MPVNWEYLLVTEFKSKANEKYISIFKTDICG